METTAKYSDLLIVIGASAGGLEQFTKIVKALPDHFHATVVLACHRSITEPSKMHEVLGRLTGIQVRQPIAGEKLCCTTIYIGDARDSVEVDGRYFRTAEDISDLARKERIDDLFKSAAESAGENCVGVILTGMLSDGAEGLKAIRQAGGVCMVQDPKEAAFDSMPNHALQEVKADFIGTTDEIAELLVRLADRRACT